MPRKDKSYLSLIKLKSRKNTDQSKLCCEDEVWPHARLSAWHCLHLSMKEREVLRGSLAPLPTVNGQSWPKFIVTISADITPAKNVGYANGYSQQPAMTQMAFLENSQWPDTCSGRGSGHVPFLPGFPPHSVCQVPTSGAEKFYKTQ